MHTGSAIPTVHLTMPRSHPIRDILLALGCLAWGVWATDVTGSYLPLALGASATLVQSYYTVKALLQRPDGR
jgi:hypothetical protein